MKISHPLVYTIENPSGSEIKALALDGQGEVRSFLNRKDWVVWSARRGLHPDVWHHCGVGEYSIPLIMHITKGKADYITVTNFIQFTNWKDYTKLFEEIMGHKKLLNKLSNDFKIELPDK
jgi:hypothetical protein